MQHSEELLGKTMHMTVKWKWDISFIFSSLSVSQDQSFFIILGLLFSIALSALSVITPAIKQKITKILFKNNAQQSLLIQQSSSDIKENQVDNPTSFKQNIFHFVYIFIYSIFHIGTMMLMMTYNGYVIICVIIGLTIGYYICPMDGDKDKKLPINCCA